MTASEDPTDIAAGTTPSRWWRWLLVAPAFFAGLLVREWVIDIGILAGSLYWVGFTIAGFIPVYFAGKMAPTRQLLVAVECALLIAAHSVSLVPFLVSGWRAGEQTGYGFAMGVGFELVLVAGAASAVWFVGRRRAVAAAGDLPWT